MEKMEKYAWRYVTSQQKDRNVRKYKMEKLDMKNRRQGIHLMCSLVDSTQPKRESWIWRWANGNCLIIIKLYYFKFVILRWELPGDKEEKVKRSKTEHQRGVGHCDMA